MLQLLTHNVYPPPKFVLADGGLAVLPILDEGRSSAKVKVVWFPYGQGRLSLWLRSCCPWMLPPGNGATRLPETCFSGRDILLVQSNVQSVVSEDMHLKSYWKKNMTCSQVYKFTRYLIAIIISYWNKNLSCAKVYKFTITTLWSKAQNPSNWPLSWVMLVIAFKSI